MDDDPTGNGIKVHLEQGYFGELLGRCSVYQISAYDHQRNCLSSNSTQRDSTGLRVYAGCHVAIRQLIRYRELVKEKNTIELGCGVGVFGLLGAYYSTDANVCGTQKPKFLLLTDGEQRAISIIERNIQLFHPKQQIDGLVSCQLFRWEEKDALQQCLRTLRAQYRPLQSHQEIEEQQQEQQQQQQQQQQQARDACAENYYDVVLGCELMYYVTDIELLVSVVIKLTNSSGIFLHTHAFRAPGQEQSLIDTLSLYGWSTLEIPQQDFISENERRDHPEWRHRVRVLVSAPIPVIQSLHGRYPSWVLFTTVSSVPVDPLDLEGEIDEGPDSEGNKHHNKKKGDVKRPPEHGDDYLFTLFDSSY